MTPTELKAAIERVKADANDRRQLLGTMIVTSRADVRAVLAAIEGQASPELLRLMEAVKDFGEHCGMATAALIRELYDASIAYAKSLPAPPTEQEGR